MKKKSLVIASSLICAFSISVAAIAIKSGANLKYTNGETTTYTMTLNKNNRIVYTKTDGDKEGIVKTDLGSEITMTYPASTPDPTGQDFIFLEGLNKRLENKTPINGVYRIDYSLNGAMELQYSYSYHGDSGSRFFGEDSTNASGTLTFGDGEGYPSYFSFASITDCHIYSLKFYYSCVASIDPDMSTGNWTYESNDDGEGVFSSITLTGYQQPSDEIKEQGVLVIPDYYANATVTRINANVLDEVGWVKHIVLPFIGQSYYLNKEGTNPKFGSIFATSSLREDYEIMAQGTESWYVPKTLKKVTISKGNKLDKDTAGYAIPNEGFYGTSRLNEININTEIKHIGNLAFAYNSGINRLYLPSSVTNIGSNAFANCHNLLIRNHGLLEITSEMNPTNCPYSVGYVEMVVANNIVYDVCRDGENRLYGNAIRLNSQTAEVVDFKATFVYEGYNLSTKRIANKMLMNNQYVKMIILPNYLEYVGYNAFKDAYRATIYATENESSIYKTGWRDGVGGYFNNCHDNFYENKGIKYALLTNGIVIYGVNYEASEQSAETLDFTNIKSYSGGDITHFAAAFMQNNTTIETIYLDLNVQFEKYSFAGCTSLTTIYFDGTVSEWNEVVSNMGVNALAGVAATVHCDGGDTTFDGTSMVI